MALLNMDSLPHSLTSTINSIQIVDELSQASFGFPWNYVLPETDLLQEADLLVEDDLLVCTIYWAGPI